MIDEGPVFEALEPIFRPFAQNWIDAEDDYKSRHDTGRQIILGPTHRALTIQRLALHFLGADPLVSSLLRPAEVQGLDFFQYDGEEADIAVLLKKLTWRKGRLRSEGASTNQRLRRLDGELLFDGHDLFPIVCGYTNSQTNGELMTIDHIYIGFETRTGFEWAHPIWSLDKGFVVPQPAEQQLLFPESRVKIRRPESEVAEDLSDKIGIDVPRKRQEDKRRASNDAGKSSHKGA